MLIGAGRGYWTDGDARGKEKQGWPQQLVYLLIMERWNLSYQDLMDTPHDRVQDMMLVMQAESRVEDDRPRKR